MKQFLIIAVCITSALTPLSACGEKPGSDKASLPRIALALTTVRLELNGPVESIAFSPESNLVAGISDKESIVVWEVKSGRKVLEKFGKQMAFSPDGKLLAIAWGSQITLWDLRTISKVRKIAASRYASKAPICFTADGGSILAAGDKYISVWDTATSAEKARIPGSSNKIHFITLSPDGRRLAVLDSADGEGQPLPKTTTSLKLFDFTTKKQVKRISLGARCDTMAFSPDGSSVGLAGASAVELLDLATEKVKLAFKGSDASTSVAFSPSGREVVTGGSSIRLWAVASGKQRLQLPDYSPAQCVGFSNDGKLVAAGCKDGCIRLWLASDGRNFLFPESQPAGLQSVGFSPDGLKIFACCKQSLMIWHFPSGRLVRELPAKVAFSSAVLSPDGKFLAIATKEGGAIQIRDFQSGRLLQTLAGSTAQICMAFSPDSKLFAFNGVLYDLHVCETSQWKETCTINPSRPRLWSERKILGLTFTSNGNLLALQSSPQSPKVAMHLWNLRTATLVRIIPNQAEDLRSFAMSPSGSLLVTLAAFRKNSPVQCWKIPGGAPLVSRWEGKVAWPMTFSPSGRYFAASGPDAICIRETASGKIVDKFKTEIATVSALAFSADGRFLISSSTGSQVISWDLKPS